MKSYAFIFARGGSKGLPGKNIRPLLGKPLLKYSIDTALSAPSIDRVFVSTDDEAIAAVALSAGAEVIERPSELASDSSPEWLSWRHAIDWVTERYGRIDTLVSLPATSPLRAVDDVERAIAKLNDTSADICISVTPANRSPFFNMVKNNLEGFVELVNKPPRNIARRQDAPEVFDITTVVYVAKPDFIKENTGIFDGKVTSVTVPRERAVDIDDIYDFLLAESILRGEANVL
ncbi:acylneuraminate cytidylyltransferase family protein [Pseudoalteromonas sp. JBTF-M23]|uniref:Acylneuraminate cytidylyltransferase family protein n=1 Tax=Pseudoalteromonas caenipelagi TaxID=2726988 RepID=A0A849VJ66_9GAMM|nr:acylneuraminate cytidylyltransferase family protein [Pseudoalteromonas caenipelagi]NOU51771.1 acylneuraminate cytidylyltransferase family protein [Pseudoalteromonas caenipelagi]